MQADQRWQAVDKQPAGSQGCDPGSGAPVKTGGFRAWKKSRMTFSTASEARRRGPRRDVPLLDEVAADAPGAVLFMHGSDRFDGCGLVLKLGIKLNNDVLAIGGAGECACEGGCSDLA